MSEDVKNRGLSPKAYEPLAPGEEYPPFVPAAEAPPEMTSKAIVAGIFFGIVFGAANAFLGLRVGLTISTSIPVAVLTVAAFHLMAKAGAGTSILEANVSQTIGSASSSLASGVIFTLPALFMWQLEPTLLQMTLLALCGGCLGVLFMIPLRRFLIAGEHGTLPYPEGTACAEVLVASEAGGAKARNVFLGLGVGAAVKALFGWIKLLPDEVDVKLPFLKKGELGSEMSAALLGVGYILGPRIAAVMVGGGLLSWLLIIPLIALFGEGRPTPLYPEVDQLIAEMSAGRLWTRYVRYIGAGAVATAGFITLARNLPTMVESFKVGSAQLRQRLGGGADATAVPRTETDLSLKVVGIGALVIGLVLAFVPTAFHIPQFGIRAVAALLVVVFAFFFVTVSSRIVGLVGVTSNPTSGMTIATLLITSSIFLLMGWTGDLGKMASITVGCVVAIAASIAGDTSQDLKTGFLLGATPRRQQLGEILGVLTSAVFVCLTVMLIGKAWGFGSSEVPAPQATLMKVVIEGVLENSLPWGLVAIGAGLAILVEVLGIPSLAFAVGVYLPVATMVPVYIGGLLRLFAEKSAPDAEEAGERRERGVLFGSGLVGGEGLLGVFVAGAFVVAEYGKDNDLGWAAAAQAFARGIGPEWAGEAGPWISAAVFAGLVATFAWLVRRREVVR